jgi:cyclase
MEGFRVLGQPQQFAQHYYQSGADELLYVDTVASLYGQNSLLEMIELTARDIFIPITVAGGLRSVADIRAVLRAGADKVSMNTAAIARPGLISEAASTFGSSTITVGIEAIRRADGTYEALTDFGREESGIDAFEWAMRAVEMGAGELMITSINREGTGRGFDLELIRQISESVSVPVIASGGAGSVEHVYEAITEGKADAVCVASLLHYNYIRAQRHHGAAGAQGQGQGNVEFLLKGEDFSTIQDAPLEEVRAFLNSRGVETRLY